MFWRAFMLAAACSLAYANSPEDDSSLEETIEQLVRFVNDNAHENHLVNQELRRRHTTEKSMKSRRMIRKMKWSTPEIRAKEEASLKSLDATKQLMDLTGLSLRDLQDTEEIVSEWKKQTTACPTHQVDCSSASNKFRSADGSCNNLVQPWFGSAATAQERFLPPLYDDGVSSPRTLGKKGQPLPSPRKVSNSVFKSSIEKKETELSLMVMAWGQFLDHDITLTPASSGSETSATDCCRNVSTALPECFPIAIPSDDLHFTRTKCMDFVRSAAVTDACSPNHREQFNAITAFVDGSNVYGSSVAQMNELRAFRNGLLATSTVTSSLPPAGDPHSCLINSNPDFCIKAGDVRANVIPHLGANHVLLFREHNRIATILSAMNNGWNDERVFQETRKIISGILQQISYYEWLPSILSPFHLSKFDLLSSNQDPYRSRTNPSIRNGFAVAAMRFGHSLIPANECYLLRDYVTWEVEKPIQQTFFSPSLVIQNAGQDVPKLARWVIANNSMKADRIFEPGVRNLLFLDSNGSSFDLGSLNIQRGRDHGVPPYVEYRKLFGLKKPKSFNKLTDHNSYAKGLLKDVYDSVKDIDLFAGGMSERKVPNGHLGPVFTELIGRQFRDIKLGDRFWFERPSPEGFPPAQRDEIRKMTLAKVMCTNFGMDLVTKDVFHIQSTINPLTTCNSIPDIDLTLWKE
ncbi:lactoperoxidase-like [Mizuhopecten yessoensis]|uniref:Peroxidasin n=1 Tax=Mizuhopecten yessoensis TaxID=6573 RepID=A0A210PU98_MIZYE|nr:lactoperoxidase-like [Mizuhopecten yessoensis]OWF40024.1 Peroxidasin [Mizuhopecten yessoensis]